MTEVTYINNTVAVWYVNFSTSIMYISEEHGDIIGYRVTKIYMSGLLDWEWRFSYCDGNEIYL